jgi:DNA excision repair protein ERCC-2
VLFSATLAPAAHYVRTLGLPAATPALDVAGPYGAEHLAVRIARHVSTRWRDRGRSLVPIADLIGAQFAARPGNYLAFFSSFDYLAQAARVFAARHPGVPQWCQQPGMDEAARAAFLARFDARGAGGIGFAVLGGAFAEGIDLPGERLIGAFIATLGLPQVNALNEALRRRIDEHGGDGFDALYLVPGVRKVVQAAGRVIRTPDDRGVVHLIDDRYAQPRVRRLLPAWWGVGGQLRR